MDSGRIGKVFPILTVMVATPGRTIDISRGAVSRDEQTGDDDEESIVGGNVGGDRVGCWLLFRGQVRFFGEMWSVGRKVYEWRRSQELLRLLWWWRSKGLHEVPGRRMPVQVGCRALL